MNDLSIIIPYFNESKVISDTFNLLINQSFKANEIIFINSNSDDRSYELVNSLIDNYEGNIKILNFDTKCKTPSAAKNFGIKKSTSKYLAFMDCDMNFGSDWLLDQFNFINNSNYPVILGQVSLKGKNLIDKISIIHTYGYNIPRPCIPSTIVKRNFFNSPANFFEEFNALYDQKWIKKNLKKENAKINNNIIINYMNIEYAGNIKDLFNKIYYYSLPTMKIYGIFNKNLFFISIFLISVYIKPSILIFLIPAYIIFRNILLVIYKSKSLSIFKSINFRFDLLVMTSIIIDIAKINGMFFGLFKKKISHYQR